MRKFTIAKSLSIAAATLALAAPFASQAHKHDAAMDSCINAFVAANLPKEQPVTVRKEAYSETPISTRSSAYRIVVNAKGLKSGKYLARGSCVVDRAGHVISMDMKAPNQRLAAR